MMRLVAMVLILILLVLCTQYIKMSLGLLQKMYGINMINSGIDGVRVEKVWNYVSY